ncbi:uncharacterized protein A1O9_02193 [Exophiala aquamarina CBS 119918]|uniref:Major facilitator superfamily (MFS) profile domain-containing protein n=1 Tax=Exophiala aquamarina CBS 119918 TaxID=1182545 RepID=A0A072PLK1_9EURO|nr:uncharacterized protein A1O9_02193 [Exophiala aquamarina CBS 119918]KEF60632.1 hypothetical protein A1O9_02193 [Exophiala aquamarina CBS 119918]
MAANERYEEKVHEADVEENETRLGSSPNGIDIEDRVAHIHAKTVILVFSVYLAYLAGGYNIVVAGAYGRDIGIELGGESQSTWLVQIVTIIIAVLSPPISEAADLWGRKWFLVTLTALGVVGCVITGAASSMAMALGGQVLSGIACSSQPLVHAIPSEVIPRRYRAIAQAGVNISIALAAVIVLLAGGALTRNGNHAGFRVLFYINAGLFGIGAVAVAVLYNPPLRELQTAYTQRQKLARLDWIGIALLSGGLTLFCMALVWSQNPYSWKDVHILAPFVIGCVLLLALGAYETKGRKDGMFHHELFKRGRNFSLSIVCIFVEGLVFFAVNNYFAFEVSTLYEHDSLYVSLRFSICFFTFAVSTALTGLYCTWTKAVRFPVLVGFGFFTIFMVVMSTAKVGSSAAVWGYTVFFGSGLGILLNTLMTAAQLGTPPDLIASASGLMISTRSVGGSIALAIYNAIFTHTLSSNLNSRVPAAVLPLGLPPSSIGLFIGAMTSGQTDGLTQIPGVTSEVIGTGGNAVLQSFVIAFRYVWITGASFSFVAMIAAWFLLDTKKEFNTHIDAPAETEQALYGEKVQPRA